jgi:hypothetical protein
VSVAGQPITVLTPVDKNLLDFIGKAVEVLVSAIEHFALCPP